MNRRQRKKQLAPFVREVRLLRTQPGDVVLIDLHANIPQSQVKAFRLALNAFRDAQRTKGLCCPDFLVMAGAEAEITLIRPGQPAEGQ